MIMRLSLFSFALLLSAFPSRGQRLSEETLAFIADAESNVKNLTKYVEKLYSLRAELVRGCTCSKHACSNDFDNGTCLAQLSKPDVCGEGKGLNIDLENSVFRVPPGIEQDALSGSLKESICTYKGIEDFSKERLTYGTNGYEEYFLGPSPIQPRTLKFSAGTRDGHFRIFPGIPRERRLIDGRRSFKECEPYDPRVRPWYIRAGTGPKDIVFLVDRSQSMASIVDGKLTKWDIVQNAVARMLDAMSFTDFVNVVTFSDNGRELWNETGLARGSVENLGYLKAALDGETPAGHANFSAGFQAAFPLLWRNCSDEPASCSSCQKIILFMTDGSQNSETPKPSSVARQIARLQKQLKRRTGKSAVIFTYSISQEADDAIPRQIACANRGAWASIRFDTDPLDALNSYSLYVSGGVRTAFPVWTELFTDASGFGLATTVAMPFYAKGTAKVPDIFLGVVGHQVLLSDLTQHGDGADEVLHTMIEMSEHCSFASETLCELQIYRYASDERAVCADSFPVVEETKDGSVALCYKNGEKFYKRSLEFRTWGRASAACAKDGGSLVSIADAAELAFLSSLADLDGSWVAARGTGFGNFSWANEELPDLDENSAFWGMRGARAVKNLGECVAIDSRGVIGNMKSKDCGAKLTYICEFESAKWCGSRLAKTPEVGYFEIPTLASCSDTREHIEQIVQPVPETRKLAVQDVVCDLGVPDRSNEEVICCQQP